MCKLQFSDQKTGSCRQLLERQAPRAFPKFCEIEEQIVFLVASMADGSYRILVPRILARLTS